MKSILVIIVFNFLYSNTIAQKFKKTKFDFYAAGLGNRQSGGIDVNVSYTNKYVIALDLQTSISKVNNKPSDYYNLKKVFMGYCESDKNFYNEDIVLNLLIGYPFQIINNQFFIEPTIGLGFYKQMEHGFIKEDVLNPDYKSSGNGLNLFPEPEILSNYKVIKSCTNPISLASQIKFGRNSIKKNANLFGMIAMQNSKNNSAIVIGIGVHFSFGN